MNGVERWFIKVGEGPTREVTRKEWIDYERQAGFWPKGGNGPATGGFTGGGLNGTHVYMDYTKRENFDYNPEIQDLIWPPEESEPELNEFMLQRLDTFLQGEDRWTNMETYKWDSVDRAREELEHCKRILTSRQFRLVGRYVPEPTEWVEII